MQREADDKVIGAKAIAFEIGCSVRTVYRRAEEPDAPIYKPCGRYHAFRSELRDWVKRKPDVRFCQVLAGGGRFQE
ncbi:putative DNA-binding transcriptional regulator AlpA [Bradyrhizobium elkanii]